MDATIIIYLSWTDDRLTWNASDHNEIYSIFVPYEKIWTPPFEIVNLDEYLNEGIIFYYDAKITANGDVSTKIKMRLKTSCEIVQKLYPFDLQECAIDLATPNLDTTFLNFQIGTWNQVQKPKISQTKNETSYNETDLNVAKNAFFDENPEWNLKAFKYSVSTSSK